MLQLHCKKEGPLQLYQAAQSPIQLDLGYFQGQGIHHLSEQLVPRFPTTLTVKKINKSYYKNLLLWISYIQIIVSEIFRAPYHWVSYLPV